MDVYLVSTKETDWSTLWSGVHPQEMSLKSSLQRSGRQRRLSYQGKAELINLESGFL